jgi:hypothetical protein
MPPILPLPNAVSEMFAQVMTTGQLTQADRYGLMAMMLTDLETDEERQAIDRLLYALRQGHIQVVNELSTLR